VAATLFIPLVGLVELELHSYDFGSSAG